MPLQYNEQIYNGSNEVVLVEDGAAVMIKDDMSLDEEALIEVDGPEVRNETVIMLTSRILAPVHDLQYAPRDG